MSSAVRTVPAVLNCCGVTLTGCTWHEELHLTTGVPAFSVNSLPDDGGIYATETCRRESDPLNTASHILHLCSSVGTPVLNKSHVCNLHLSMHFVCQESFQILSNNFVQQCNSQNVRYVNVMLCAPRIVCFLVDLAFNYVTLLSYFFASQVRTFSPPIVCKPNELPVSGSFDSDCTFLCVLTDSTRCTVQLTHSAHRHRLTLGVRTSFQTLKQTLKAVTSHVIEYFTVKSTAGCPLGQNIYNYFVRTKLSSVGAAQWRHS
jgi:hypothetical protein